jgi:hypothetical protein
MKTKIQNSQRKDITIKKDLTMRTYTAFGKNMPFCSGLSFIKKHINRTGFKKQYNFLEDYR